MNFQNEFWKELYVTRNERVSLRHRQHLKDLLLVEVTAIQVTVESWYYLR